MVDFNGYFIPVGKDYTIVFPTSEVQYFVYGCYQDDEFSLLKSILTPVYFRFGHIDYRTLDWYHVDTNQSRLLGSIQPKGVDNERKCL